MRIAAALPMALLLTGCRDVQSVLAPQGPGAVSIAVLSWVLFIGAGVILAGVAAMVGLALARPTRWRDLLSRERTVVYGGIVFPVVTLAALLVYGVALTGAGAGMTPGGEPLRVRVAGELWWWRVFYTDAQGRTFETANELRIPVDRRIEIELSSDNVIHSFWVPSLAGKLDMIPGRTNLLTLSASSPGISRGQCAEYCGGPHALMSFDVIAMPAGDFDAWLAGQSGPAAEPQTPLQTQGRRLFRSGGCAACHTIRGTEADGRVGPDLTHVASRRSIGAALLPTSESSLARWIVHSQTLKPENRMPPFGIFSDAELAALAAYLGSLE